MHLPSASNLLQFSHNLVLRFRFRFLVQTQILLYAAIMRTTHRKEMIMMIGMIYRHRHSVTPETIICPSVPLSVPLSVCPAIKAYISVTMSWIWMKLGGSVGT